MMLRILGLLLLYIHAFLALAEDISLNELQRKINQNKAGWEAAETSLSILSAEEQRNRLGLLDIPKKSLGFEIAEAIAMPSSLDWRANPSDFVGEVMDQGRCNSCVSFASVGTLMTQMAIARKQPSFRPQFSTQQLFSCGGGRCAYGWFLSSAASFLQNSGVADAQCLAYTSGITGKDVACNMACSDWQSRATRISSYDNIFDQTDAGIESVITALQKGPVMTSMKVYYDFFSYKSGIYKHVSGGPAGGHAVSVIGYDREKRAWIFRNSWGTGWGMNGFGMISWDDDSNFGTDSYAFNVALPKDTLTLVSPTDQMAISQPLIFDVQGSFNEATAGKFVVTSMKNKAVLTMPCQIINDHCKALFQPIKLRAGKYKVYAMTSNPDLTTQSVQISVYRSVPKVNIAMHVVQNFGGVVKGNMLFDIGTVETNQIEFRVTDAETGEIKHRKQTRHVGKKMRLRWDTNEVPNGKYKISLHGETPYVGKSVFAESKPILVVVKN